MICVLAHKNENVVLHEMRGLSKCLLHSTPKEGNSLWCKKLDILQGKMISQWVSNER